MDDAVGLWTPLSFVQNPVLPYTEEMTFFQRVYNVFLSTYESFLRRFNYIPAQNRLARKYFRDGIEGDMPHVLRLEREISIMLVNSHPSIHLPRPTMPSQIDVGGAHIRQAKAILNPFSVRNRLMT